MQAIEKILKPDKEAEGKKLYALKSIREYFAVSDRTLRSYIKNTDIKTIRIGHIAYIEGSDLVKLLQPKQRKSFFRRR